MQKKSRSDYLPITWHKSFSSPCQELATLHPNAVGIAHYISRWWGFSIFADCMVGDAIFPAVALRATSRLF